MNALLQMKRHLFISAELNPHNVNQIKITDGEEQVPDMLLACTFQESVQANVGVFMPKIKTRKLATKKFRVAKNRIKRAQANLSHHTAKKAPKRKRHLGQMKSVDSANIKAVRRMLPNSL